MLFVRTGDRLWYEEESGGFSKPQLETIRKASLARVLCDNSDDVSVIQVEVFELKLQKAFLRKELKCFISCYPHQQST